MIDRDGTEACFLSDVAQHQMYVLRDDGLHRHIRFKRPDSSCYYFDLITWPGHLCYTGDMGTYVFQRLDDMFEFFRTDRVHSDSGHKLKINRGYWTEKLIAIDGGRHGGKVKEFDEDAFRRVINEYRVQWMRDAKAYGLLDKEGRRELWEQVDDDVFGPLQDGGERAQYAAYDFQFRRDAGGNCWSFEDLFEHDFTDYTFHITWCCFALAWGIEKYDAFKASEAPA